ncbi:polymorphic toxin type 50 domain-containing protein [Howardella ureilytica]
MLYIKDVLKVNKQREHIFNIPNYRIGKIYIYGDKKTVEDLYNEFSGKGDLIEYKGEWLKKERITAERTIGVYIDQNGVAIETNRFMIIYSKSGYHIYQRR